MGSPRRVDDAADLSQRGFAWIEAEPGVCAVGVWENVTLIVWWSQATGPAVERVAKVTREVCANYRMMSNIHIIKDKAHVPTAEAREGFVRMMKDHAGQLANVAVVVGGVGFWASMMRSAVTGMRFVSPRSFEMRLHGEAEEILGWLPSSHAFRCGNQLPRETLSSMLLAANRCVQSGSVELVARPLSLRPQSLTVPRPKR
ncbi:MAG TPA: hypothetical protein VJR89_21235 [Polyangiales bacterium]|nr:hypothetical protein [Polyangiales bacterium]